MEAMRKVAFGIIDTGDECNTEDGMNVIFVHH